MLPFDVSNLEADAHDIRGVHQRAVDWWREVTIAGCDALMSSVQYATLLDRIVQYLFEHAERSYGEDQTRIDERAAIVALGGYGRCEMSPYSDLDLLVLYDGKDDAYVQAVTSGILYPLWDAGFDVGCVTRTLEGCRHIAASDPKSFTSMLDARYVAGDEDSVQVLQAFIKEWFSDRGVRRNFMRDKFREHEQRKMKYGDSVYLLQPNIKDGEGGLRDFHTLVWLMRASFPDGILDEMMERAGVSNRSIAELYDGVRFLWRVRHALHLKEGRKQDRLGEEHQADVAAMLGFKDDAMSSAAERLMQEYYRHATVINRRSQWAFERIREQWSDGPSKLMRSLFTWRLERGVTRRCKSSISIDPDALKRDPGLALRVFVHIKRKRLSLDASSKELLVECIKDLDPRLRASEMGRKTWRELFRNTTYVGETVDQMHECGVLEVLFPEMGPMMHRIQHDGFHIYTVDIHTVHALRQLAAPTNPVAARALRKVRRPHVLLLATLLHDIGKGHGAEHERIGAEIARDIATDMGFSAQDVDDIEFLVRSHMLMPKLAFCRDINDQSLIERFAQTVRTPHMLAMLYLITYADLRSVGPQIWNAWKEGLLNDLYLKTRDYLSAGGQTEIQHKKLATRKLKDVKRVVGRGVDWAEVEEFVARMPHRYLLTVSAPLIGTHFGMMRELSEERPIVCDVRNEHERGISELSVVTNDAPGLFARIAGVIAAHNLNVVDAELYTTRDGVAVDVIRLNDIHHRPVEDMGRWRRVIDELNAKKKARRVLRTWKRRSRGRPAHVEVDNDVSAAETVVEVHADDRPGLLHRIATVFADVGCTIDRARISTHVDRVIDVFYIRDRDGQKVTSRERVDALRDILKRELDKEG